MQLPEPSLLIQLRLQDFQEILRSCESELERLNLRLLKLCLETAVPLRIHEIARKGGPDDDDFEYCDRVGTRIASQADHLVYREKAWWYRDGKVSIYFYSTRDLFKMIAEALAVMAFMPGGVTFFGGHFEAKSNGSIVMIVSPSVVLLRQKLLSVLLQIVTKKREQRVFDLFNPPPVAPLNITTCTEIGNV